MRKSTALLLALLLCCTMVLPAAAEEGTQTLTVEYKMPDATFKFTIPSDMGPDKLKAQQQNDIGMFTVTEGGYFTWDQYVLVTATPTPFKDTNGNELPLGNGTNFGMHYKTATDDGTEAAFANYQWVVPNDGQGGVTGEAHHVNADGPVVDQLVMGIWPSMTGVPFGTYTATITFTAEVKSTSTSE